jgi:hypothetical protein
MLNDDKTLQNLSTEELKVIYNKQFDKMKMHAPLNWNNFPRPVRCMFKNYGCQAFQLFFMNSVPKKPNNVKLLMSYLKAWKSIIVLSKLTDIFMLDNKSPETAILFGGQFVTGAGRVAPCHPMLKLKCHVTAVWPNILVIVNGPADLFEWKNPQCLCTFGFGAEAHSLQWKDVTGESNTNWKL